MKEHYTRIKRSLRLVVNRYLVFLPLLCLIWFTPTLVLAQCTGNVVLNISGPATLDWTAPATGGPFLVKIEATGASGGSYLESNPDSYGGSGATMIGNFIVQNGEKIRAIAGEGGYHSQLEGGGGGGGSGAVNCGTSGNCNTGSILIIAAGGNGGQLFGALGDPAGQGEGGSALTNGSGDGGMTYIDTDSGGGGGGVNGSGNSAPSGGDGGGQVSTSAIALGGAGSWNMSAMSGNNKGGDGMGGGGGGGDGAEVDNASGGGGGHTGGWGGNAQVASSFNAGANQINTSGVKGDGSSNNMRGTPSDPGLVTITCLNVLPVSLINFRGFLKDQQMTLVWSTATEIDNLGFDIEHSVDGRKWSSLGFVTGFGTTTIQRDYNFEHTDPQFGVNYYRLKQMDYDGNFEYSPIVVIDNRTSDKKFEVFPNPSTNGALSLRLLSNRKGSANLEIFDWTGLRVYKDTISLEKGTMVWPISMSTFPKGAYTAKMELPSGEVQFKKILLQ